MLLNLLLLVILKSNKIFKITEHLQAAAYFRRMHIDIITEFMEFSCCSDLHKFNFVFKNKSMNKQVGQIFKKLE